MKEVYGYQYTVFWYRDLVKIIENLTSQLLGLGLPLEKYMIEYTSGGDIDARYGYERNASELSLIYANGNWWLYDLKSVKIPYEPITFKLKELPIPF